MGVASRFYGDVSLLTIQDSTFEVKAAAGNTHLDTISSTTSFGSQAQEQEGLVFEPCALRRLRTACEQSSQTSIEIDSLFDDVDVNTSLTRACFEELCQDLFCGTLEPVEEVSVTR